MSGVSAGRLSLAYREIAELQAPIVKKYAQTVRELDLSNNNFSDLSSLREFSKLETLVLDNNRITSHTKWPPLPSLKTLWVNKNSINNLATFIDRLVESVPNIKFLSMLNNDACPNFFNGGTLKQYKDYRNYVISRLRNLETLDDAPVTAEEKADAWRIYGNLETTRTAEGVVTNYVDITSDPAQSTSTTPAPTAPEAPAPEGPTTTPSPVKPTTPKEGGGRKHRHRTRSGEKESGSKGGSSRKEKTASTTATATKKERDVQQPLPLPDVEELTEQQDSIKPPKPAPAAKKKVMFEDSEEDSFTDDWSSDSEDELIERALKGMPEIDVDLPAIEDLELPDDEEWFGN